MIDPEELRAFMHSFYGYGNYDARYWFIGLEEGGVSSADDLTKRIAAWRRHDSAETQDLYEFHREIDFTGWFGERPKRQATWARLVQIVLMAEGRRCEAEDIVRYQADHLGRVDGETLLSEALPLPGEEGDDLVRGRPRHAGAAITAGRLRRMHREPQRDRFVHPARIERLSGADSRRDVGGNLRRCKPHLARGRRRSVRWRRCRWWM
jgi:hypothetical protein